MKFNFDWLLAKLQSSDVDALTADYDHLPEGAEIWALRSAIRLSAHVLDLEADSHAICRVLARPSDSFITPKANRRLINAQQQARQ
jgi:hypothetical protein